MTILPVPLPRCPDHGSMTLVSPGAQPVVTRWCGVWYECGFGWPRCGRTVLIASSELLAQLDEQRACGAVTTVAAARINQTTGA